MLTVSKTIFDVPTNNNLDHRLSLQASPTDSYQASHSCKMCCDAIVVQQRLVNEIKLFVLNFRSLSYFCSCYCYAK